jgi:enterobactin synthetase component F
MHRRRAILRWWPRARCKTRAPEQAESNQIKTIDPAQQRRPTPSSAGAPLSDIEGEIWQLQQQAPRSGCCWIAEYIDIEGTIDEAAFESAVHQVLDLVPAFHAIYADRGDGPRRYAPARSAWTLQKLDYRYLPDPKQSAEAWMRDAVARSPGLEVPRLFHTALLRIGDARYLWFHAYHHICMDPAAGRHVTVRVARAYNHLIGAGPPLPAEPDHPATTDAAIPTVQEAAGAYWRDLLDDWAGPIRLAGGSAPPGDIAIRTSVPIDPETARRFAQIGRAQGLPRSHVIVAALTLWLNAVSGRTDLVFALAVRARGQHDAQTPAMRSNVVPVRLAIDRASTLASVAGEFARQRRAGQPYEFYRGSKLLQQIARGTRSLGPVISIMPFDYRALFHGCACSAQNISIGPVDDLCLSVFDRRNDQELAVTVDGNANLYSEDRLRDLADKLGRALATLTRDPACPAASLDVLGAEERRHILETWNATARDVPTRGMFHFFAEQVCLRGEAPFLSAADVQLTYREAGVIARRVADQVRPRLDNAAGRNVVAILLPRSPDFIVALLAVSMLGAAFLPIDPANPPGRIATMLSDVPARVVITSADLAPLLPAAQPLLLVAEAARTVPGGARREAEVLELPYLPPDPARLAYVFFTSGSTGRPKAVAIPERGLANLAMWQAEYYHITDASRVLQFSGVAFDAVTVELLMAIAVGACLYIVPDHARAGGALGQFMAHWRITHALLPPVVLTSLDPAALPDLETIVVGGDVCPGAVARSWSVERRMFNVYGATETTMYSTWSDEMTRGERPPVGRPMWNTRVYILDAFGRPVPVGVEGELHIAGIGIGVGYLGDEELTRERFIPCPFGTGGTMFRTGDKGRFDPDGVAEWLGRTDRQVKLRGIRVELGEIESALGRLPEVTQAVATTFTDAGGRLRIAAYVVPTPGAGATPAALRAALTAQLPRPLIPSNFVFLDRMPLTPHGKVDPKALPSPLPSPANDAPMAAGERELARLFAEVLGVAHVGTDDDFFELGGDSLSATVLIHHIESALDCHITIADIFANPTVATLARYIGSTGMPTVSPLGVVLGLRIARERGGIFCFHVGSGLGWAYSGLLRFLDREQSVYALQARGLDGRDPLAPDLPTMALDYAREVRRVQPEGPYCLLGWSSGGAIAHAVATCLQATGGEIRLLASLDGYPTGEHYLAGIPGEHEFDASREHIRRAIQTYLDERPIQGLRQEDLLDKDALGRMARIHMNTGRLLAYGQLDVFRGDLLLFTCSVPYEPTPMPPPDVWRPFVTGTVETVVLDCHHDMMLMPGPAEVIAQELTRRLRSTTA